MPSGPSVFCDVTPPDGHSPIKKMAKNRVNETPYFRTFKLSSRSRGYEPVLSPEVTKHGRGVCKARYKIPPKTKTWTVVLCVKFCEFDSLYIDAASWARDNGCTIGEQSPPEHVFLCRSYVAFAALASHSSRAAIRLYQPTIICARLFNHRDITETRFDETVRTSAARQKIQQ